MDRVEARVGIDYRLYSRQLVAVMLGNWGLY